MEKRQKKRVPNSKLRTYRHAQHWTQEEFAAKTGVSVQTLRRWENGEHAPPTPTKLRICQELNVSPSLLGFEPEMQDGHLPLPSFATPFRSDQTFILPSENQALVLEEPSLLKEALKEEQAPEPDPINLTLPRSAVEQPQPRHPALVSRALLPRVLLIGLIFLSLVGGALFAFKRSSFSSASPSSQAACFSDEFHTDEGVRGWQWIDNDHDSVEALDQKGFSISVSQSNKNLWAYNNNAPRLVQSVTGNFTVETQIEFEPQYQYQGAGLLVYGDSGNYIRLERAFSEFGGIEFERYEKSRLQTISSTANLSQMSLELAPFS